MTTAMQAREFPDGWSVPDHVPAELVHDEDLYGDRSFDTDMHARLAALYGRCPDIFWSPHSGGYWVVMRRALIDQVMTDPAHFSSRQGQIPPVEPALPMLPLTFDPPAHTPYRLALMQWFGSKTINTFADEVRELARDLVDKVAREGEFEFVRSLGAALPVTVFMRMMGLPLTRFDEFRTLVLEFFSVLPEPRRIELYGQIRQEMTDLVAERRKLPGKDVVSMLMTRSVGGRSMSDEELVDIAVLLFVAGMDTVANAAAFAFYYLACDAQVQERLARDPGLAGDFVEESLRMYGVVNTPRQVVADIDFAGAPMRKGDMVFVMLSLAGRDGSAIAAPDEFDLDRSSHPHMVFGGGPHVCAGQHLARLELKILVEEWLKRVDRFEIAPGFQPQFRCWQVMALSELRLAITTLSPAG